MIALIVALAKNRVIGNNGVIPWHLEGEQKRFKELTTGNVVVMGRRTYEEIGRPLPNRTTIVVSKTANFDQENCTTVSSLEEALALAGDRDVYISGGARLYEEALPLAEKLYLTEIHCDVEGDTFFPEFDKTQFDRNVGRFVDGEMPYEYVTYTRK